MKKYHDKNQTPATPAVSLMYGLDFQLTKMMNEGLEQRFARHKEMSDFTKAWAKKNFALFGDERHQSITLTTIANTREISVADLNKELGNRGYHLSNGYGALKEKTFRIAHMADFTVADVKELLDQINDILGTTY
jgi:aspartate aminotransferase-like enzyme